jgi:hypothetical protein
MQALKFLITVTVLLGGMPCGLEKSYPHFEEILPPSKSLPDARRWQSSRAVLTYPLHMTYMVTFYASPVSHFIF